MSLIEAILAGIQFKGLQKPIVFLSMLIGLLLFGILGLALFYLPFEAWFNGKGIGIGLSIAFVGLGLILLFLSGVCGHFIKRCFR
jgi:hypothetical protein